MSSSNRQSWALLLLRVAVGLGFLLHALSELRTGDATFHHAAALGGALAEAIGAVLILIGLFQGVACLVLGGLLAWPLVMGWIHGAPLLARIDLVLRLLGIAACGVGGPGKWGLGKG
jgi:hypothetical protein